MKKGFYIVFFVLLYSSIYPQDNQFGLRLQAAFNSNGTGVGGGIQFTGNIDSTSSFRLLLEYSTVTLATSIKDNDPIVRAGSHELLQIKAQYLYYFTGRIYHLGAGIGYFNYALGPGSSGMSDEVYHISSQQLANTIGFDIILGTNMSDKVSAEINYIISFPELSSRVTRLDIGGDFYTKTQTVNMSTVYLNLIFSFNTQDL